MSNPAVRCENLQKRFGDVVAVASLSFTVAQGEIYGLLGPNGAGKTTTMRVLAGLLTPSAGRVEVSGVDVSLNADLAKQRLGYLSGGAGLYPRLSPREIMTYTGRIYGMNQEQVSSRTAGLCAELGMASFMDRKAETLSTGQKQRVCLARAVFHDPATLILDEPTSGLDVLASLGLRQFMLAQRERGKAIVICTHYLAEAELICDRVGFVHNGRMVKEGTPQELRAATGTSSLEQAFLAVVSAPGPALTTDVEGAS